MRRWVETRSCESSDSTRFPHHVIVRGNNRRNLFSYPRDRDVMLSCMLRAHALERCRVEALMLMRNHVHLVITPDDAASLSRWMKSWEQRYAVYRNRDRGASGKLFEQRFKTIAITSERQLAATVPYVEVNPTRAGCCDDPADWRWSTYPLHAGTGPAHDLIAELWQPSSWWLALSSSEAVRGAMYRAHTARRVEAMDWRDVHPDSVRFEPKADPYTRRLRRPDGSRAAESLGEYRRLATSRQALNDFERLEDGE